MTGTDDGGLSDRVLQVATRLFAGLGYDGTDMRQIADAAGTDVAYVRRRFGDKREIYLEVMDRMNSAHNAVLEKGVKDIVGASPEQKIVALHRLLDRYIDFCRRQPEYPALYTHRWLSDATDIPELEPMYAAPAAQFVIDTITPSSSARKQAFKRPHDREKVHAVLGSLRFAAVNLPSVPAVRQHGTPSARPRIRTAHSGGADTCGPVLGPRRCSVLEASREPRAPRPGVNWYADFLYGILWAM
ncbi:TetR/AcrR family transcriptional regulator [Microbispora bryophytorum]|uniref:HTH tetR-type domain-containing protein n=1 Tax=Microbispora bryophytorum TaxID=1460882 RepID=A0A8H9LC75_9ACTN|nr:TetR/AcrR family transcriptional regulator [Microbispora bryophytorum]MBD3136163.1 TetR/AcrR family transcriptional regulator [Microbispora bryophytorum]TQS07901.1 TetR/AcrR family transcriptional regulator [Microbispora bryophytorum]GGO04867.1 hypothetical protein GCM10011574_16030 [Microbispora bryophytorum]